MNSPVPSPSDAGHAPVPDTSLNPPSRQISANQPDQSQRVDVWQLAIARQIEQNLAAQGQIAFPCMADAVDMKVSVLMQVFRLLGRTFTADEAATLQRQVAEAVADGKKNSVAIIYATAGAGLQYRVAQPQTPLETVRFSGSLTLPAMLSLRDGFCQRLRNLFALLDRPTSQPEAQSLRRLLAAG